MTAEPMHEESPDVQVRGGARQEQSGSGSSGPSDRYREFKPHPAMKTFLYVLSLGILTLSTLSWSIPVSVFVRDPCVFWIIGVGVHVVYVVLALWFISWVPRYYERVRYGIQDGWLEVEGGVYWRNKSRLPAARVQLVEVTQGPWQRKYGVYNVLVHTAARGSDIQAELGYLNVENGEALRDRILAEVRATGLSGSGLNGFTTRAGSAIATEQDRPTSLPGRDGVQPGAAAIRPDMTLGEVMVAKISELSSVAQQILEELRSQRNRR